MTNFASEYIKNKLENYRYWYAIVKNCASKKYELDVLRGMHSPAIKENCVQGSQDQLNKELHRLELIDIYDNNEEELMVAINELKTIQKILMSVDRELIAPIFKIHCIKTSTYEKEAKKIYMHQMTLKRKVNRELTKYLENSIK